ncbi:uncharacterized protein LOC130996678 [Salvia miltiorrhiza]|uniref:uncharacterized protein LOC130996678 n=1 Tax=Salvia miltiorrhiza TaxID=226208 RepID=UPI0025AB7B8C|nr:uncharacterized protein LOC130996678 [Salvia miltiorrhiza]
MMEKLSSKKLFDTGGDGGYDAVVVGSGYGGSVAACRMSMAGFKVCLLEKGRRWESSDFPTDSFKILSTVRMENRNLGVDFGPKDALFQVHVQGDALAATACGLGGGSLVNAGVMISTPARARRDPRWPKSWETDWDRYEASASEMLRVRSMPVKFHMSKIMEGVMGEEYGEDVDNPIKLSMNLEIEEASGSRRPQEIGNCLACGNCLSGCPYNAKNSTDKTYVVSAVQAGCTIRTQCEVQYVVRNEDDTQRSSRRRWLVFINEFDCIATDAVILSAGVFGTAKILFQSQLRGLAVSDKLGSRLSCNGNNVAYLAGSSAPLNSKGLHKTQISNIPFQERPGPSISSSYTSSLGFTIQSAVVPTAYPSFLFKGIVTYGWETGYLFLYGMIDRLKYVLGLKCGHEMVLNAIGHDDSSGKLTFEKDTNRILFQPPHDHLLPRKIEAFKKLARKLGGVLFMSRYRSTSVHLLGGCVASLDVASGVCNPQGQVFDTASATGVHSGLYICDASIIPCSVGINPCLTIAAAAEHVSRHIVRDCIKYVGDSDERRGLIHEAKMKASCVSEVMTRETMRGQVGGMPFAAYLKLRFEMSDAAGKSHRLLQGKVGGYIECRALEIDKLYVIQGEVDLCKTNVKTPYTQYMHYHLLLAASSGSRYVLEGRKIMNPYLLALYTWRESTTLNVTLRKIASDSMLGQHDMNLKGKLHISPIELLKSVYALEGGNRIKFVCLLMQSLLRTYILQLPRGVLSDFTPKELAREPYPESTIHEIKTEDNFTVSCQHWKCSNITRQIEHEKKSYPALLINGYATESYCLPTEKNDLVRTLLKDGHDVWLLHARLHWSNSSNHFSVEDIGRLDILGAIRKIIEFYGPHVKVHVVAHCVGGLAVHISLMGGHVSAKNIASLSCTNSSMFFKLTTSSSVKMWLPLLPISMAVLGENTILPMLQGSATSYRHRLLKRIARLMPRCERCTCHECEVFSGIFGNAFWHENISQEMHQWMNKENLPRLPMAAFPHLRKICNAGFIVDSRGNNSYLIHPERMALPTLYISGGRTLLATPETSFLGNKYMKLHQPGYRHERVVVDGFGHSDLLIGEESCEKVFPHIQRHIELAEEEMGLPITISMDYSSMKDALAWSVDLHEDGGGGCGSWISPFIIILLLVLLFRLVIFMVSLFVA